MAMMVIDANLLEGFKIGMAAGVFLSLMIGAWVCWTLYKAAYTKGCDDAGKEYLSALKRQDGDSFDFERSVRR